MAVVTVTVETFVGKTVFGPQEVDASINIRDLKALFEPERRKKLSDKASFQPLEDEDCLPDTASQIFLLVGWIAMHQPVEEDVEDVGMKLPWEKNFAEALDVGDTFGNHEEYTMEKLLANGGQAQVFACRHCDGGRRAVKVFRKSMLVSKNDQKDAEVEQTRGYINFKREVESLEGLRHQRIVRALEVQETKLHCFLIMELGQEDLEQWVTRAGALKENEARHIFKQLLEGISYMHSRGVLHRDLKLENIIVDTVAQNPEGWDELSIMIGDFGLSKKVGVGIAQDSASACCLRNGPNIPAMFKQRSETAPAGLRSLAAAAAPPPPPPPDLIRATTTVGSDKYIAPEVLSSKRRDSGGHYDKEVDYFSLGVCLYRMLTGEFPNTSMDLSVDSTDSGCLRVEEDLFDTQAFQNLPANAQTLVGGLMRVDAASRFTLEDCRGSDWAQAQLLGPDPLPPSCALERLPSVTED